MLLILPHHRAEHEQAQQSLYYAITCDAMLCGVTTLLSTCLATHNSFSPPIGPGDVANQSIHNPHLSLWHFCRLVILPTCKQAPACHSRAPPDRSLRSTFLLPWNAAKFVRWPIKISFTFRAIPLVVLPTWENPHGIFFLPSIPIGWLPTYVVLFPPTMWGPKPRLWLASFGYSLFSHLLSPCTYIHTLHTLHPHLTTRRWAF